MKNANMSPSAGNTPEKPEDLLALRESALAVTAEGVTISDARLPSNPIIYANAGFERLTGYTVQDVVGNNCRFLQGPMTDSETVDEIREAVRQGTSCTVQLLNYRKDGTPFWNRLSITPLRNAAGDLTHFVGVQSDVTEQKRIENALAIANDELKSVNERMARDLDAAAQVQRSLLPSSPPSIPGVTLAWAFRPCDELAGDILNVRQLDSRHLGLYMIDVSGHGVASALFAVTLSRFLSAAPSDSCLYTPSKESPTGYRISEPAKVAEKLNQQFPFDPQTSQYFTMLYGVLDVETLKFTYAAAGQSGPLVLSSGKPPSDLSANSFPIGLLSQAEYEEVELQLAPGDRLYLITDGLTEAENAQHEEFGMERFLESLDRTRELSLDDANNQVMREVEDWCGDAGLRDDASILSFHITADQS